MLSFSLTLALLSLTSPAPSAPDFDSLAKDVREILGELVTADTTNPPGNEAKAVKLIARRLKRAHIPYEITTFAPGRDNIVARIKGDGSLKPLLLLAHLDVVGTSGQTWSSPPHTMTERDGYLFGRGVADDLSDVAEDLALGLALAKAKTPLRRDLILAFTGDEESGGGGTRWLIDHARESIDAEVAFNEGGGPLLGEDGKVAILQLEAAQKTYQDFEIATQGTTGHSSIPLPDNAIADLASAITAIASHPFPDRLLPVTRAYLASRAPFEAAPLGDAMSKISATEGALPADLLAVLRKKPSLYALLHTTCVPTLLSAGTRVNALPASATANINCRILPGETVEGTRRALQDSAGPRAKVTPVNDFGAGVPSPLDGLGPQAVLSAGQVLWPGVKLVPNLSNAANDSRFLRSVGIRAYGFHSIPRSDADNQREHGLDERISANGLRTGAELLYRLVMALNPTN